MADWSVWKALEEWRSRRHELDPVFAKAGIAPEVESAVNMVCVNLRRQTPTAPLLTGEKSRDEEEFNRYYDGYYRHFDDSLLRVESLLRLQWVPEMAPVGEMIRVEVDRLRKEMRAKPGRNPGFDGLEKLLRHYVDLDHPSISQLSDLLTARRKELIDVAGYPLLVQYAVSDPYNDAIPPLYSDAFRKELFRRMAIYRETAWLHNRVITNAYVVLALDSFYLRKKQDAQDDSRVAQSLKSRWPTLSVLLPGFEQADQVWYLLLTILAVTSVFLELWVIALPVILWLNLSIGAHRREKKGIAARREQLIARVQSIKRTRDRFAAGHLTLEKLAFQFQQMDEENEFFEEVIHELAGLHQHEE